MQRASKTYRAYLYLLINTIMPDLHLVGLLYIIGTSVVISEPCLVNFERKLNIVFQIMKAWFNSNFLSLNFDKTYYMQFITKINF